MPFAAPVTKATWPLRSHLTGDPPSQADVSCAASVLQLPQAHVLHQQPDPSPHAAASPETAASISTEAARGDCPPRRDCGPGSPAQPRPAAPSTGSSSRSCAIRSSAARRRSDAAAPEADLAEHFGVSLITVRQALRELEADGLIRKRSAKPAVVADPSASAESDVRLPDLRRHGGLHPQRPARGRQLPQGDGAALATAFFGLSPRSLVYCPARHAVVGRAAQGADHDLFSARQSASGSSRDGFRRRADLPLGAEASRASAWRRRNVTVRAETADAQLARELDYRRRARRCSTVEMLYQSADRAAGRIHRRAPPRRSFSLTYDAPNDAFRKPAKE